MPNVDPQPLGTRRYQPAPQADPAVIAALRDIPAALLSDNMRGLVGTVNLRPYHRGGRMAGTAITVRVRSGDNLVLHRALDHCRPGDVIVVDANGELRQAITGKIMARYLEHVGAAGLVVDGAVRGTDAMAQRDFPVFARGTTPRGPYKTGPGEINVPICIDGMVVSPGDIIVGDSDGLVAFPPQDAPALIAKAREQLSREDAGMRALLEGNWDRSWITAAEQRQGLP